MGISGSTLSATFSYDPNGNQTSGLGRTIAWTSYNAPASITQGTRTISFLDDTDHQRFKQITPEGSTLYIAAFGVLAELSGPGTAAQRWTEYLAVGNAKVGMRVIQTASATLSMRYFLTDHLGSISVITDEADAVVERLSYDAWGKRRFPDGTDFGQRAGGTIVEATAGGGKFANGAVTSAFGYLFNELGGNRQRGYEETTYSDGTVCNSGTVQACITEGALSAQRAGAWAGL